MLRGPLAFARLEPGPEGERQEEIICGKRWVWTARCASSTAAFLLQESLPESLAAQGGVFRSTCYCPSLLQPLPSPQGHLLPRDSPAGTSAAPGRVVPAAASPRRGERWCRQPPRPRSAAPEHTFRLLLAGTRNQLPHFARAGDRGEASAVLLASLQ